MITSCRAVRLHHSTINCALRTSRQSRQQRLQLRHFSREQLCSGSRIRSLHTLPTNPQPLSPRILHSKAGAFNTTTFLVAVSLATGIAYITTKYYSNPTPAVTEQDVADRTITTAPEAWLYPLTMAPSMPPGRPGNLTADQEAKLKEMWLSLLEIFGVAHDEHANGTSNPSNDATASPDSKKKKKSRLSMFRGKGHDKVAEDGDTADNDKHGQTKEFQQALANLSPEAIREAFWSMSKHDHPDALLLRFLRARKWDVHAALVMAISTLHWRMQEMKVDEDIMYYGEEGALNQTKPSDKKDAEDFMAQLRMGKSFLHGTDKSGRPICNVRVKLHRPGQQSEASLERFTVYTIETTRMMLRPPVDTAVSYDANGDPVYGYTILFDLTDFSLSNMDYTPVKFMIKCFEANYPESLGCVLVYKAPWVFQGIWKIIKGWLDPVVASKIHFAGNVDELSEFIAPSHILKELGGEEDWTYKYVEPSPDENAAMKDTASKDKMLSERTELQKSYETETLAWIHGNDAGEGRGRIAERLAENYWKLDPYIRARSLYDRVGILGKDGRLEFYPIAREGSKGEVAAAGGKDGAEDELD